MKENLFLFEFTDNYIIIYDKKQSKIIKEDIDQEIIVNNKIYDFKKLQILINRIVEKNKIINNIFKTNITFLLFEKMNPSEIYLYNHLFLNSTNINLQILYVNSLFKENIVLISGKKLYYNNHIISKNKINNKWIIVGYSLNNYHDLFLNNLVTYENSDTIIYEKV